MPSVRLHQALEEQVLEVPTPINGGDDEHSPFFDSIDHAPGRLDHLKPVTDAVAGKLRNDTTALGESVEAV